MASIETRRDPLSFSSALVWAVVSARWVLLAACFLFQGVFASESGEDRPYQFREPKRFWLHQAVFQKRGIVIEDDDFIVRKRYWVLDRAVVGQVVQVDTLEKGLDLLVRFDSMAGWQTTGMNIQNRMVAETERSVTIRQDYSGDGVEVDTDEVTFSYTIEGEEVDPDRCGVIERREGNVVFVRFPSSLMSLVSPRVGDRVTRSFDWHDGFADGGSDATGLGPEHPEECFGIVERERDEKGFIYVRWERTGRKKSHRFDNYGYYDVQLAVPAERPE